MKTLLTLTILLHATCLVSAQSILGEWQLMKETNCVEDKLSASDTSSDELVNDMKSMSSATPVVVKFKEKMAGEESMRILTKRRSTNNKNFLYRFDGEMLVILDKRSRTITDSFIVDKFDADSLILSNVSRPCEMRVFRRMK